MEEQVIKKSGEAIERIIKDGIATTNIDNLYKLIDIYKDAKEVENMNYGNYRGNYGRDEYGAYDGYGARQRDSRGRYMEGSYGRNYRGHDYIDRMANDYGRYMESRERYGASKETEESYRYMTEALKDFTKYLFETAETPQQKQMLREAIQSSMM